MWTRRSLNYSGIAMTAGWTDTGPFFADAGCSGVAGAEAVGATGATGSMGAGADATAGGAAVLASYLRSASREYTLIVHDGDQVGA